jgi:hypothetical protein
MDRIELIWLVRIIGILGILAVVVGSAMPKPKLSEEEKKTLRKAGFRGPITGLELSRSTEIFRMIAGSESRRNAIRRNLSTDFLFIPIYVLLYVGLAVLLAQRGAGWPLVLAVAADILAVAAGVFDVVENRRVLPFLDATQPDERLEEAWLVSALQGIWLASVVKWTALAASSLLLAPLFLARHSPFEGADWYFVLIGLFLVAAGIGLGTVWRGGLAELSITAMLLALALVLPWAVCPAWFLDKLWS